MKRFLFLSAALAVASVSAEVRVPYAGPRANPDDQMRFFWYMSEVYYPQAVAAGFNTFITFLSSTWHTAAPESQTEELRRRLEFLARMEADGVDCVDQVKIHANRKFRADFGITNRDGSRTPRFDYGRPDAKAFVKKQATYQADLLKNSPALVGVQTSSEVRGLRDCPSWTKETNDACMEALGFSMLSNVVKFAPHYSRIPGFPVSRVVSEKDRYYAYCLWFWKDGDSWNRYQDDMAAIFNARFARPLFSFYDPITRTPPVWGSGGHVSIGSEWYYPYPRPNAASCVISELQAMARGVPGQQIAIMPQGISKLPQVAPRGKRTDPNPLPEWAQKFPKTNYCTTPPDLLLEAYWTIFSRKVDGIGAYAWNSYFSRPDQDPKTTTGYVCSNPASFETVSNLFRTVAVPLGPLLRAIPERPPEVALIESSAQCFFVRKTSFGGGYVWGDLATLASLPPYVLFDEEIARDGIPASVKVLLMPDCEVLTETTAKAVRAFQRRGGVVAADEALAPALMPDVTMPRPGNGTEAFKASAAQLKADLAWAYRPYADADTADIFVHVRSCGSADYAFAINDRRTFGDYIGGWKKVAEKGLPNSGTVRIRRAAGAVYDLVQHQRMDFTVKDGVTEIPVAYSTCDGRALMVTAKPLAPLAVSVAGGRVSVRSTDADELIPIEVTRANAEPYYGVIRKGKWAHDFGTAENVVVKNLATGERVKGE